MLGCSCFKLLNFTATHIIKLFQMEGRNYGGRLENDNQDGHPKDAGEVIRVFDIL